MEPVEGELNYNKKGNVVEITNEGNVVGYNIFEISKDITIEEKGHIKLTDELVNVFQKRISEAGFDYKLNADLSPKFVVGYVETKDKHPDADKLSVLNVNVGNDTLQIVCGAPNVEAGQKVVVAKVGAVMPSGMVIKDAELRGVASSGMICSMKELNLPNAPEEKGIMVLNDSYEIGQAFFE
ncbi:tRNA-binding protein [Staphylococcus aureus]|uniref:YtpR family tRNA-binding protein n=1 Tax=Staphylococcus aureus TaxID=1280 RepID=UPI00065BF529|nr:tRNA-binding protein [Staphylococcus aureus]ORO07276.1 tRNA-binding protein [Staphylococcus aureus]